MIYTCSATVQYWLCRFRFLRSSCPGKPPIILGSWDPSWDPLGSPPLQLSPN